MLVSVVVANHNYERYLPVAIDSVLGQTHPEVELIVVDDGSTDRSREVLAGYAGRLVAIHQDNAGQAAAVNAGIARARGELVCMLDADDAFVPDKVERVLAACRATPGAVLINHQMQTVDGDGEPVGGPWPPWLPEGDLRATVARTDGWYPRGVMSSLTFTRGYLERVGPIPTARRHVSGPLGEVEVEVKADTFLSNPAAFAGPVAAVPAPLTRYRVHGANKSGAGQADAALWNRRVAQYAVEHDVLVEALERLGIDAAPSLDGNLMYQLHLRALGKRSLPATLAAVLRSPALPASQRLREAARVVAGRGWSRRVPR